MKDIVVYNTLTRKYEKLETLTPGLVKMYVCGPTVYDHSHIGHARTYVAFDGIKKYLMLRGYQVLHVQNITDIDDKIINKANELGVDWREIVETYSKEYFELMGKLGIRANINPRVTEHIPEIIEFIDDLIKKGYAYVAPSGVYFDVDKYPYYGQLSGIKDKKMWNQETFVKDKKNPYDFALWKCAKPGEPWWESPWCKGRPGWHIECSTMSSKYLGKQFDIHGGARDLIFPHHENEIAQSEARFGVHPWVRYWLHTGYLTIKGEKMSKSLGNIIALKDVLAKYDPKVVRLWLLSAHYRTELNFDWEALERTKTSLERMRMTVSALRRLVEKGSPKGRLSEWEIEAINKAIDLRNSFHEAMSYDFNTPKALASVSEMMKLGNEALEKESYEASLAVLGAIEEADRVFEVFVEESKADVEPFVELLVEVRKELRNRKLWDLADMIRSRLAELGVRLLDKGKETEWRFA
ncbi:cysteinyl-tRNA synthetase [Ignicoccus pacificus DSM 13166]|uniref:Cysteine--tRNA ligase n=1 Tax=Ignicoccus pacificus DSM 13166 TaxID=940294 RepID=A0A977KAW2_9CREN|nr:cysteinyl-tRNA synthetase [Ignicoccus pacificus DSM 13166]